MGKIEIDHTGSGGGITLSSDGTNLLLDGTAVGGSPDLYAENYDGTSTLPSATGTNAVAMGVNSQSKDSHTISIGHNTIAGTGSGSDYAVAIGYHSDATGYLAMAIGGNSPQATGTSAVAIGGSTIASGSGSVAIHEAYSSGIDSLAMNITTNSSSYGATGANSVAIGPQAKATGQRSFAATYGVSNNQYSIAFGPCVADQARTFSSGFDAGAYEEGKFARSSGSFNSSSYGQAQYGLLVLRSDTTNATAEALTSNNSAASTTNQIILQNNSAFAFHGTIVARQKAGDGTASAAWKIEGLIRREGSAGTTVLVNSATTVLDNTPSWGMALSADTTNGGLKIEVTGAASTNIRWVATIHTSEVTYA